MKKSSEYNIPFTAIKDSVLGRRYELSLVFVGQAQSRRLNREHRAKDKPTNVLAFALSKTHGEIFIDLVTAKKEAKEFHKTFEEFVLYLFIHALLHLKGMLHGATMDGKENSLFNSWRAKL